MKSLNLFAALTAGALAVVATSAFAQEAGIYTGQPVKDSKIRLGSWGSGSAVETSENSFSGPNAIKVTTHGRYMGARIMFDTPLELKSASSDASAYLQFTYQVRDRTDGGGISGFEGGAGTPYGGGRGRPGGLAGGGQYSTGGGGQASNVKTGKPKQIANLRVVLVTTDNKKLDTALALEHSRMVRDLWRGLAVPVAAIPGIKDSSGQVKEIHFFADNPGVIYLGEVRILRDDTPITVEDLDERTIAKNDSITFTASAEAGPTPLKYEWTIQGVPSTEPGSRSEATAAYHVTGEGKTFKHQFRKSGDYKVTLTVSDVNGLKKAVTKTTTISVTL